MNYGLVNNSHNSPFEAAHVTEGADPTPRGSDGSSSPDIPLEEPVHRLPPPFKRQTRWAGLFPKALGSNVGCGRR